MPQMQLILSNNNQQTQFSEKMTKYNTCIRIRICDTEVMS